MFYEIQYSTSASDLLTTAERDDFQFPLHLHKAFECIVVTEGKMRIRVEKECYEAGCGDAVLVFPEQVHALESVGHSRHFLTIFAPEYVKAFVPFCMDHVPAQSIFTPTANLAAQMKNLTKEDSIFHIKSTLYTLIDEFDRGARYLPRSLEKEALLFRIFDYVSKHYTGECTLKSMSSVLPYHYAYLSRYFSERTGIPFSEYVNSYRITESCYRLTNSGDSISRVALDCGFESFRSFHRNFKAQMGQAPGEYRAKYLAKMEKEKGGD